jgi:polar amino acid transport system substrate-binding protein
VSVELARAFAAKLGVPIRLLPYDDPARYNESLGKDEWDIGLAARDPSRGEHLVFSDVFMEVDNRYVARPGLPLKSG